MLFTSQQNTTSDALGLAALYAAGLAGFVHIRPGWFLPLHPPLLSSFIFHSAIAILSFYAVLVFLPGIIMRIVTKKAIKDYNFDETHSFYHIKSLATASNRTIVCPCPDLLYSWVRIEFNRGVRALKFTIEDPGSYSSLSFFSDDTNNFHVCNFDDMSNGSKSERRTRTVVILGPSETNVNDEALRNILGVDEVVRCPSQNAMALQRIFVPSRDMLSRLGETQGRADCTTLYELPDCTTLYQLPDKCKTSTMKVDARPGGPNITVLSSLVLLMGISLSDSERRDLTTMWSVALAALLGGLAVSVSLSLYISAGALIQQYLPVDVRVGCWAFNPKCGETGADVFTRSVVAVIGLLALCKSEAIYMLCTHDDDGERLDRCNDYVIRCPKTMPGSWWSITAYGANHYLIPNEADVYSISGQSAVLESDGTVTMHWSRDRVARNWLPTGELPQSGYGTAQLVLRLYKPHNALRMATAADAKELCQTFEFPVVKRVVD